MTGNRPALSAVVITRDAGRHLAATLASLAFCAERLVLDSGSTDDTVAIARAAGARVEHQPFLGYGLQKRRAVELAAHDWILSLDADESLDEEATAAIQALDLADPQGCYAFRRRTFVGEREVRHGPWGGETVLRLFHRRHAEFSPLPVHEQVEARTAPRLLPGSILHHSFTDSADVIARSVRYARLKADVMRAKGQRPSPWALPARGAANFLKSYVLQSGWRDGPVGFVIAVSRVIDSTLPRALVLLDEIDPAS
jgi:glycosyltransferase involved in cell wall biosynthesis